MQLYGVQNLLGRPTGIPDERMMTHPIWSTWAQFKVNINESVVRGFAEDIRRYGFQDSQLEIDDDWESCYGEAAFNTDKFPDAAGMIADLNAQGFRTTLWVHPFINMVCPSYESAALGLFSKVVRDTKANNIGVRLPGLIYWWQGALAGIFDFTDEVAASWYSQRLRDLQAATGIDSFKFDGGETNWLPSSYELNPLLDKSTWPSAYTTKYVENMATFGNLIEVRVGWRSQQHPIFVRMLDKVH